MEFNVVKKGRIEILVLYKLTSDTSEDTLLSPDDSSIARQVSKPVQLLKWL